MQRILLVLMVLGLVCSICCGSEGEKPASRVDYGGYRPHYQGYGLNTKGGRGGQVLRVTNLNDSGAGSLRAALEAEGARIVIFETSGTIALESPIQITQPFITIAGQTAPSPGINIRDFGFFVSTHDVVIQHLRFRYGDSKGQAPHSNPVIRIGTGNAKDIVLDHVSITWAIYIAVTATEYHSTAPNYGFGSGHPTRISLLDCIFSHPLSKTATAANNPGLGTFMGHMGATLANEFTNARNLYVHSSHRNPLITGSRQQVINDVIYGSGPSQGWAFIQFWPNWASADPTYNQNPAFATEAVITNNRIIPSIGTGSGETAGTLPEMKALSFNVHPDNLTHQNTRVWLHGNQGPYITGPDLAGQKAGIYWMKPADVSEGGDDFSNSTNLWYPSEPAWHAAMNFQTLPTNDVPAYVLANAGARPLDRDPVDIAAVAQTKAGLVHDLPNMGSRITSPAEMGGYPKLAVNTRPLQAPENPHAIAPGQKFRTNIEMWLEKMARALEPAR